MNIIINIYNCIAYGLSVTILLMSLLGTKETAKKALYFLVIFLCDIITFGKMEQYSMLLIAVVLTGLIKYREGRSFLVGGTLATAAILLVLFPVLIIGNALILFWPQIYQTGIYNILMGGLLVFAVFLCKHPVRWISKWILGSTNLIAVLALTYNTMFIILFVYLIPNLIDKPFLTIYAVFGFTFVFTTVFWFFMVILNIKIEKDRSQLKKKYAVIQERQRAAEKEYKGIIEFKHYYMGLYKPMAALVEEHKWNELQTYFRDHIVPAGDGLFSADQNIDSELKKVKLLMLKNFISATNMQCAGTKVNFSFEINNTLNYIGMDEKELVLILNVFIENAFEACEEDGGRVELLIHCAPECVVITVQNTYLLTNILREALSIKKGEGRGNGLKFVDKLLKFRRNVLCSTTLEKGMFIQELRIEDEK